MIEELVHGKPSRQVNNVIALVEICRPPFIDTHHTFIPERAIESLLASLGRSIGLLASTASHATRNSRYLERTLSRHLEAYKPM